MKDNQKVVVIGLDGGTLDLMKPWIEKDELPTFKEIVKNGIYGKLKSTTPYYSAPAWVSISTGCNPGKHGIYDFFRTDSYKKKIINSRLRRVDAIWNILTKNDKKSIVVNVPGTYPPDKINGFMITGLLTPSYDSKFTHPENLKDRLIKDDIGKYELERVTVDDLPKNLTARYAPEKLAKQINEISTSHAHVTMKLMKECNWDFAMMVFRGTDDIQHLLWNRKDLILSCYKKADSYIGEMIKNNPDAQFIIVSDHGFGLAEKYVYINNALYNAGYIKTISDPSKSFYTIINMIFEKISRFIFHLIPIQKIVRTPIGRKLILSSISGSNIDFSKTTGFYFSVCSRGIRITLKDKYKTGSVKKGDYEKIRKELIDFISNLRDPETKQKIVKKIYNFEEIYGKDAQNDPLDIIFDLKEEYSAQELLQPPKDVLNKEKGKLTVFSKPGFYDWIGDHRPHGILFMYGNNIKKGEKIDANVVDIVPTVLASMNIPIPNNIDGNVIKDAFIKEPSIKKVKVSEKQNLKLSSSELKKIKKLRQFMKK